MRRQAALFVAALLLLFLAAAACGGGGGGGRATPGNGPTATPGDFELARDALVRDLDNIGANIGSVPDDIRDALIATCLELGTYVDQASIERICPAIGQAVDANDPGLINVVVEELATLGDD